MKGLKRSRWRVAAAVGATAVLMTLFAWAGGAQTPTPTPYSMDLYGEIAGAVPGDVVTVYDPRGTLCGAFTVTKEGQYGFLHVYGDDKSTPINEGAELREPLLVKLNGAPLTPLAGEPLLWLGDRQLRKVDFRR